jgi:chromosomal replication initiator protein
MNGEKPLDAASIWQTAYGELQMQMPRATFDTWLRGARLLAYEDGSFIIGVANTYAREWLEHRLKKVILRTLAQIAGRSVEVSFVIWSGNDEKSAELHTAGPLLAALAPPEPVTPHFELPPAGEMGLNLRYTLDAFAVGASNRMAHSAALAVIETPGEQFNPLVLHGGFGLGKTHLLHAIGNACNDRRRILQVSAESFTNDLIGAIRAKRTEEFRRKYRDLDLLLLDDLDFMAGKEATQEEFYYTFNHLSEVGAQVVIAANHAPSALKRLDARIASRCEGGLVVELSPPDFTTRMAILQVKARQRGFDGRIPYDVFEMLAGEIDGSVRDLEGALNRVIAAALLSNEMPDISVAEQALGPVRARPEAPGVTLNDVIMAVADYYHTTPEDLCGRGRSREVSTARQVAIYLAYQETSSSLQELGDVLGGRNHSTVLYARARVDDLLHTDSDVRRAVLAILRTLRPQTASRG